MAIAIAAAPDCTSLSDMLVGIALAASDQSDAGGVGPNGPFCILGLIVLGKKLIQFRFEFFSFFFFHALLHFDSGQRYHLAGQAGQAGGQAELNGTSSSRHLPSDFHKPPDHSGFHVKVT